MHYFGAKSEMKFSIAIANGQTDTFTPSFSFKRLLVFVSGISYDFKVNPTGSVRLLFTPSKGSQVLIVDADTIGDVILRYAMLGQESFERFLELFEVVDSEKISLKGRCLTGVAPPLSDADVATVGWIKQQADNIVFLADQMKQQIHKFYESEFNSVESSLKVLVNIATSSIEQSKTTALKEVDAQKTLLSLETHKCAAYTQESKTITDEAKLLASKSAKSISEIDGKISDLKELARLFEANDNKSLARIEEINSTVQSCGPVLESISTQYQLAAKILAEMKQISAQIANDRSVVERIVNQPLTVQLKVPLK